MEQKNNILEVENLSIEYGSIKAVKAVNLTIRQGEFIALIGPNGAGKTSLLKGILGVQRVREGHIYFSGKDITNLATDKIVGAGLCLIPEGHVIFSSMTVLENLQLGAYHLDRDYNKSLKRVLDYFPILQERRHQVAETLSGGERQILSMGRALMSNPKLILIDEPSLGLAPKMVADIYNIISELHQEGYSILLAEQNAKKALTSSNRCYVMKTGEIIMSGYSGDLMQEPKIRQAYFGDA